jgi:hypothetical protein
MDEMKGKFTILKGMLVVVLATTLFTSCEKDKKDPIDNLIGTWNAQTTQVEATVGGKTMNQYFTDQGYTSSDAQLLTTLFNTSIQQSFTGNITFNSDKTYTANLGGQADTGTWNISSDNKQITIDSNTDPAIVLNVDQLTSDILKVNWTETGQEDLNSDDVPESISVKVNMTFNK